MPTLADLLRTPGTPANTVKNTLSDLWRGYNREAVAGLLGAPVDMANTVSNLARAGIGYTGHKLGLLATPPDLIEKPALGSDWIYERLPAQPALTGSGAENTGRMLGALLSPPVAMQAAPAAVRALGRALQEKVPGMAENYLRGIGGLKDIDVWHGSPHKFDRFDLNAPKTTGGNFNKYGVSVSENKEVARRYADDFGGVNAQLYKVDANISNPLKLSARDFHSLQTLVGEVDHAAKVGKPLGETRSVSLEMLLKKNGIDWNWQQGEHPIEAIKRAGHDAISGEGFPMRSGGSGQETLVFNPDALRILERNGVPIR